MNRVTLPTDLRCDRFSPAAPAAACAPVLSACPAALFIGLSGGGLAAAGTMYEVAYQAAVRQVERDRAVRAAARLN